MRVHQFVGLIYEVWDEGFEPSAHRSRRHVKYDVIMMMENAVAHSPVATNSSNQPQVAI